MYVKVNNGSAEIYPYTTGMLRKDHPNTSFPKKLPNALLAEYNMYFVDTLVSEPAFDQKTQGVQRNDLPTLKEGKWVLEWTVYEKTAEQIATDTANKAFEIRKQRDDLLAKSDWTQLPDAPLTDEKRSEWSTYRQELRDISTLEGFPYVELPVK